GVVHVHPGVSNIVPARGELVHEMRGPDATTLEALARRCASLASRVARRRGVGVELRPMSATAPALCAERVQAAIEGAGAALGVFAGLAWVLVRFRDRPGAPPPPQTRGHTLLELSWTIAPALVLLLIAIPTIQVIFRTQAAPAAGALEVLVRGRQWWWEFRYPALDVATANELHLPAG